MPFPLLTQYITPATLISSIPFLLKQKREGKKNDGIKKASTELRGQGVARYSYSSGNNGAVIGDFKTVFNAT